MKYILSPSRLKRWPRIVFIIVAVGIIGVVSASLISRQFYLSNLKPVASDSRKSVTVTIPSGFTLSDIATLLSSQHLIRNERVFTQYVRNQQASNDLKAGIYELSPSQSVQEIVSIITGGKVSATLLTILPGQRLDQIKQTFLRSGYSQAEVDRAFNPNTYKGHPALVDKPSSASLEGYLYPESFQKTGTAEDIVRQSLDEMQKRLTPAVRNAIEAQGLSVHQGIILASIVEKEADRQADRDRIAQVFLSRLRAGINLQSDVTAFYGALIAGQQPSVNFDSRYNTYLHAGLPVGPISNVSASSLQAVAHPASTDFLYFVAGDDGTVYFAQTKAEHEAQVAKYCLKNC